MNKKQKKLLIFIVIIILIIFVIVFLYKPKTEITPIKSLTVKLPYKITNEILSLFDLDNSPEKYVGTYLYDLEIGSNKGFIRISDVDDEFSENSMETDKYPFISLKCVPNISFEVWWQELEQRQELFDALENYDCTFDGEVDEITVTLPDDFSFVFNKQVHDFFNKADHPFSGIRIDKDDFLVSYGKTTWGEPREFLITLDEKIWDEYYQYYDVNTTYEAYRKDVESSMGWDSEHYNYYNFRSTSFKNGYYWTFDASFNEYTRKHARTMWFCAEKNISIEILNIVVPPFETLTFGEIGNVSEYLC